MTGRGRRLRGDARRGQRGRGGQVLRLDRGRDRRGARRGRGGCSSASTTSSPAATGKATPSSTARARCCSARPSRRRRSPRRARSCSTARAKRMRPGRDDKILADWNGLMIAALARAGLRLRPAGMDRARRARLRRRVQRLLTRSASGRLRHSYRAGQARARRRCSTTTPRWRAPASRCTKRPATPPYLARGGELRRRRRTRCTGTRRAAAISSPPTTRAT